MRLALLSTARINRAITEGARGAAGVEIVALGSRDPARARTHAAELGLDDVRLHGSYEAVLEDPGVDAVYVALPNAMHLPWAVRALEAGKHVLCEKPLSRHPAEVERAFEVAERTGRVLAEAFMWRHHPQAALLRELLERIGDVRLVRGSFSFAIATGPDLRLSGALEGGALMDVGCYCVSAARFVCGEPVAVTGQQTGGEVDLRFAGTMAFANGALAHFDCAMDLPFRVELEVVGATGSVVLRDPFYGGREPLELRGADGAVEEIRAERADPYAAQLRDFAAAVSGERPQPFGRADAVGQARTIAALYASAASGATRVTP